MWKAGQTRAEGEKNVDKTLLVVVVVWDARLSMLDCHLVEGVWYIYDWDTGWLVLMW